MSNGKLGAADLAATTPTTVYNPSGVTGAVTVSVCNRNATPVTVRLAISAIATPTAAEYIEYDVSVPGNGVLERTGLVIGTGQFLVAYASATLVSVVAYGYED